MSRPLLLLVDDSPELALIVRTLGGRAGHEVLCRPDVPAAWACLGERSPDLVLLDVHLPGESGLELCRRIRAHPRLADLPVALFSHGGLPADLAAALEAGVDFRVSKELVSRPADWRRRLDEILLRLRGRGRDHSLTWRKDEDSPPGPTDWVAPLNRALRHPCLREIGGEGLRVILRRALGRSFGPAVTDVDAWVPAGAVTLSAERAPAAPPEVLAALAASLAEQVWRLLGTEASQPFWGALAAAVPGSPEPVSR